MAEAPIQELSSANRIRQLAGMPIEAQPAPRQEEPPAWSEIKDSEDYKTLTYPEQVNLARQWGAETKQYAASLQEYTPEQDAQIDDFVNKDAVDVPTDVKVAAGAAGLVKGSSQLLGGIAGGLGGGLAGGPVGAIAGGVGGAIAGGELAEAGLQKFTPNVARAREFAPGYATAGEYAPAVVAGTVGGAQLVQAGRTLFAELGAKRGAEEMAKAIGVSAGVGAGVGTGVRGITGGEVSPGTIAEDALFGALFAGLGSGSRVKGYNREQAYELTKRVKEKRASKIEIEDFNAIMSEGLRRKAETGLPAESGKRTTVDLGGRRVLDKAEIVSGEQPQVRPQPTAELPPAQPIPPVELAETGVRGNVRGTQADTAEMQRRGIITPMQESLVDLNDPVPRTGVFTTESQGINREAITPDTRGLQGEIVREGQLVTPRTQLPTTERLALLGRTEQPSKSAIEAARTIELEKGMEERIRQSPQGRKGLRKDLEAQEPIPTPEEDIQSVERQFEKERLVSSNPSEGQIENPGVALAEFIEPADKPGDGDVIDFVIENGGIISNKQARIRKNLELYGKKSGSRIKRLSEETGIAEYDSMPEMNFYERGLVYGKQSLPVDKMAQLAYETLGIGDGTSNTFGPIIGKALKDRAKLRKPDSRLESQERFIKDVLTPSKDLTPVSAQSLSVGDVLKVKGGDVRVVDIDPDTMQPILDGGDKYGKQTIRTDSHVFVKTVNNKNIPTIPRPMRGRPGEAGFIVSDVQEGAAKVAKKWLTTEGNLPKEMFDIMESKG